MAGSLVTRMIHGRSTSWLFRPAAVMVLQKIVVIVVVVVAVVGETTVSLCLLVDPDA